MVCPKCGCNDVNISNVQVSGRTSIRGPGCLWSICRIILIICTCGLWLLFGRRRGTARTKYKNLTMAVCQNCGKSWRV